MKESLQEQLARLTQAGILKASAPESPPHAVPPTVALVKSDSVPSQPTQHELLILDNKKLSAVKTELEQQWGCG